MYQTTPVRLLLQICITAFLAVFLNACGGSSSSSGSATLALTFSADKTQVAPLGTVTLKWSTTAATDCVATGDWFGSMPTSGIYVPLNHQIPRTYSFILNCSNGADSVEKSVTVVVPPPPVITFTATAGTMVSQTAHLQWSTTDATACTASGEWSGTQPTSGSTDIVINTAGTHSFTLNCTNQGLNSSEYTVVVDSWPYSEYLHVFPPTVHQGDSVDLTWAVSDYPSICTASGGWSGTYNPYQDVQRYIVASTIGTINYTLTCNGPNGTNAKQTVSVFVTPAPAVPQATAYQITPAHDGLINFPAGIQFPVSSAWSRTLSGNISYPLIADGQVFVTAVNANGIGTSLYALDAATGNTTWGPIDLGGSLPWSNATSENGVVYTLNADGTLKAYDDLTGAQLWAFSMPTSGFESAPTVLDGVLSADDNSGNIYAVNVADGTLRWKKVNPQGYDGSPIAIPFGLYLPAPCSLVWANPDGGSTGYSGTCSSGEKKSVTSMIANQTVFVRDWNASPDTVLAESLNSSSTATFTSSVIPAASASQLFTQTHGTLAAINFADKSTAWTFTGDGALSSAPIVVNGYVFVGSTNGNVYAIDASTGLQAWTDNAGAPIPVPYETSTYPLTGLAAGEGWLAVPAGTRLTVWKVAP